MLIADDHSVVRHGLVAVLSRSSDMQVDGEASDGESAIRLAADLRPDVAILDVRMPGIGGIAACREILKVSPSTRVVILTSFQDEEALVGAMLAGARGYALKNLDDDRLVEVIRAVARGESVLDSSLGAAVARGMQRLATGELRPTTGPSLSVQGAPKPSSLSDIEQSLLRLIAGGHTNREIAVHLHYTEKTVRNYISSLLAKLHLRNRAEAAAYAVAHNLATDR